MKQELVLVALVKQKLVQAALVKQEKQVSLTKIPLPEGPYGHTILFLRLLDRYTQSQKKCTVESCVSFAEECK